MEGSDFRDYLEKIISYPFMSTILGLVAIFLARFTEIIVSALLGFLLGVYVVFPKIVEYFPKFQEWVSDPTVGKIAIAIVGVVSGAVVYALFKLFVFLASFLTASLVVYYALSALRNYTDLDNLLKNLPIDPEWIYIGLSAVLGVWVGFIAQRRERDIFAIFSIIVGSFISSVAIFHLVATYLLRMGDTVSFMVSGYGSYILLALFAFFVVSGLLFNFRKGRAGTEKNL